MHSENFLRWLENNNLLKYAQESSSILKKVLINCLDVKDEQLIIIGDTGLEEKPIAPVIAGAYYLAAKEMKLDVQLLIQEPKFKGEIASENIREILYNLPRKNVFVFALSCYLGKIEELGTSIRTYAFENYHRFASTINLGNLGIEHLNAVISAIDIDYKNIREKGQKIKEKLDSGDMVHITTEAGTDLFYGIKEKSAALNAGRYNKPRTGGNIPCGEVYIAPKWKGVYGKAVIDGSSTNYQGNIIIKNPITMAIEKGEVIDIQGSTEAELLRESVRKAVKAGSSGAKHIGELGIGINPNAEIIGATIVDEKKLGTAHIALGNNHWFGGTVYTNIHLDQIFKNPKIYIDDELLVL